MELAPGDALFRSPFACCHRGRKRGTAEREARSYEKRDGGRDGWMTLRN